MDNVKFEEKSVNPCTPICSNGSMKQSWWEVNWWLLHLCLVVGLGSLLCIGGNRKKRWMPGKREREWSATWQQSPQGRVRTSWHLCISLWLHLTMKTNWITKITHTHTKHYKKTITKCIVNHTGVKFWESVYLPSWHNAKLPHL